MAIASKKSPRTIHRENKQGTYPEVWTIAAFVLDFPPFFCKGNKQKLAIAKNNIITISWAVGSETIWESDKSTGTANVHNYRNVYKIMNNDKASAGFRCASSTL